MIVNPKVFEFQFTTIFVHFFPVATSDSSSKDFKLLTLRRVTLLTKHQFDDQFPILPRSTFPKRGNLLRIDGYNYVRNGQSFDGEMNLVERIIIEVSSKFDHNFGTTLKMFFTFEKFFASFWVMNMEI